MKAQLKNSRNISFLNSLEERCAALENEKKCLEEYKVFLENEVKELKFQIEGYENHFQELGKTLEKSSDYYIKTKSKNFRKKTENCGVHHPIITEMPEEKRTMRRSGNDILLFAV